MIRAFGAHARPARARWLARSLVLTVIASVVGLVPAAEASATGAAVENFALVGSWQCTSNCDYVGTWGIKGTAGTCQETEAEVEFAVDVPPTLACHGAYFVGNINSSCTLGVCIERGSVDFYLPDASDPGYTIGPIPVAVTGTAVLASVSAQGESASAFALTAAFTAVDEYPWSVALAWAAGGELQGFGCGGSSITCTFIDRTFAVAITGVQVDR